VLSEVRNTKMSQSECWVKEEGGKWGIGVGKACFIGDEEGNHVKGAVMV
jgi:hypothetical protein